MKKAQAINWVVGKEYKRADGQVVRCLATDRKDPKGEHPIVLMNLETGELTTIDITGAKKTAINAGIEAFPWTIIGEAA